MKTLREALEEFDGVHTAPLIAAKDLAVDDLDGLVALCDTPNAAIAATWVVKALVEDGVVVNLPAAFATLAGQTEWAAQLHLLQCIYYAPTAAAAQIETVRSLLSSNKTLVRVWALDAFVRIAGLTPELQGEACALVDAALDAKAASLRARARELKVICAGW